MSTIQKLEIPRYYLYGDQGPDVELDFLHVEAIRERSRPNDWRIRPHSHPDHLQILHVGEGGGSIRIEERTLAIDPPAIIIVPAGLVHQIDFHPDTEGFVITASLSFHRSASVGDSRLDAATGQAAVYPLDGTGLDISGVRDAFTWLHREFIWSAPGRRMAITAQYIRVLVAILRLGIGRANRAEIMSTRDHDVMVRYRALLEIHFKKERGLKFYADALGVTHARLNAACKARAGKTASDLLYERVIIEAKRYLVYTESSAAQVAHMTGFDDPAYFNRFFAKRVGMSPGQFRRKIQNSME